jgi:transcriptional regulator with XRE-family HTH domain
MNSQADGELLAFGRRVRVLRGERGTSQETLAAGAGLDRTVISRFEHGTQEPRLRTILSLARALGVTPGRLLDDLAQISEHRLV